MGDVIHISKAVTIGRIEELDIEQISEITDFMTVEVGDEIFSIDGKFYQRRFGPYWGKK